ncbi:MAG: hypothetical protein AB8G96_10485 [Phycisphaerales bacterium]
MCTRLHFIAATAASAIGAVAVAGPTPTVIGFDGGSADGFSGNAFFEAAGGNPDGRANHLAPDLFFNDLRTGGVGEPANDDLLGDYSALTDITFSFDIRVDTLRNFNGPISREIGIMLIDRDIQGGSGPSGVFFNLGIINETLQDDYVTLTVTIDDPTQTALPSGWIGFGDEDPQTFAPILPAGASFATVLAGVDEFRITGAIPGFFFGPANMDLSIDNITLEATMPPAAMPSEIVVGFDGGDAEGFMGNAFFEAAGGNPDGRANHLAPDLFFNDLRTGGVGEPANDDLLGDYSALTDITFSFDIRVDTLRNFNGPISREIGIMLIDRDIQGGSGASGVFFNLGIINETLQDDYVTLTVTIDDPTQTALPSGWIGFGDEDPQTFEPILPAGASFATVLAGVDEFRITGAIPGFFFGPANMDLSIDNISLAFGAPCLGDLNGDDEVSFADVLETLSSWGPCPGCPADLDGSGTVDFTDLLSLLSAFGPCP